MKRLSTFTAILLAMAIAEPGPAHAGLILSGLSPPGDTIGASSANQYDLRETEVWFATSGLQINLRFWAPLPVQLTMDGEDGLVLGIDLDFGVGGVDPLPVELGLDVLPGFGSSLRIVAMDGDAAIFGFPGGTLTFLV